MRRRDVQATAEFRRVQDLPRRKVSKADAEIWADVLTPSLRTPRGEMKLKPWQALALAEIAEEGGAYLGYPVGTGKTLIYELAPRMLEAERPVLVIPASARAKTYHDRSLYGQHFRLMSPPPHLVSIKELTLEKNQFLLDQLKPDLLMIDECDILANPEMSATVRIDDYVVRHWESCRVVAGTGTPGRKSLMDLWHVVVWCLKDKAPLPLVEEEARAWAAATDEVRGRRVVGPGVLGGTVPAARKWIARRLAETPGVLLIDEDSAAKVPLTIRTLQAAPCPVLDEHYRRFVKFGVNPGGLPATDPLTAYRLDMELGSGLYQYWDPPPPPEWRQAYTKYARFVRATIRNSRGAKRRFDTEKQVTRHHHDHPFVKEWQKVKPTFTPRTKVEWLSDATIQHVFRWLNASKTPSIVWCGTVAFAEVLADLTGLSYYRAQGKDQHGNDLHLADATKSIIVSWEANYRVFNLQAWRRALIAQFPPSAKRVEQILGRNHRGGADKPVHIDILCTSGGAFDNVEKCLREAAYGKTSYVLTQKILRADVQRTEPPKFSERDPSRYRWARGIDIFSAEEYGITER